MARPARHALARACLDPPKFLDVDVDQLTRALALIAPSRLQTQPPELAHPDPRENPRDRRERHLEDLSDLRASESQPPERCDRLHPLLAGAMRDRDRGRG